MSDEAPWWADGLPFECHGCGACCRGAGNVWISDAEIATLARVLAMPEPELRAVYTRRAGSRPRRGREPECDTVLRSKRNQDCVFWEQGRGCTIYEHRPRQCRTYPFWRAVLRDRASWDQEAASCRGIGSGPVRGPDEIERMLGDDGIPLHRTELRRPGDGATDRGVTDRGVKDRREPD